MSNWGGEGWGGAKKGHRGVVGAVLIFSTGSLKESARERGGSHSLEERDRDRGRERGELVGGGTGRRPRLIGRL